MFSSVAIGILAALSAAAWSYTKAERRTGGNVKNSSIVAGFTALVVFILVVTILKIIDSSLGN